MKYYKIRKEDIKKLIDDDRECMASDKITVEGNKINFMYREEPTSSSDSGWHFFEGSENEEYTNNPDNFDIYSVNTICNYDPDIIPYLDFPVGTQLERDKYGFKEVHY